MDRRDLVSRVQVLVVVAMGNVLGKHGVTRVVKYGLHILQGLENFTLESDCFVMTLHSCVVLLSCVCVLC